MKTSILHVRKTMAQICASAEADQMFSCSLTWCYSLSNFIYLFYSYVYVPISNFDHVHVKYLGKSDKVHV